MLVTVIATVWTNNLAIGVILGVLVAMVAFANRVAHFVSVRTRDRRRQRGSASARYTVDGELFFASSNDLYTMFDYAEDPDHVVIDMHRVRPLGRLDDRSPGLRDR